MAAFDEDRALSCPFDRLDLPTMVGTQVSCEGVRAVGNDSDRSWRPYCRCLFDEGSCIHGRSFDFDGSDLRLTTLPGSSASRSTCREEVLTSRSDGDNLRNSQVCKSTNFPSTVS